MVRVGVIILFTLFSALSACSTDSQPQADRATAERLVGEWSYQGRCIIEFDGTVLSLTNEQGYKITGTLKGTTISAPAWAIAGEVSTDYSEIHWSNGVTWKRSVAPK